jgi:DNA-binding LacI/PurR family transcriptional regulator
MTTNALARPRSRSADLAQTLRPLILDGRFPQHLPLPSHRQMAAQFGEGVQVVRSALAILEEEGLVYSRQRQGTFIRRHAGAASGHRARVRCVTIVERVAGTSPGFIRTAYLQAYSDALEAHDVRMRVAPCTPDGDWEHLLSPHHPLAEQACVLVNLPHAELMTWLGDRQIPFVVQNNRYYPLDDYPPHHCVYINKTRSGFDAAQHLLSLGHEHVGFAGTVPQTGEWTGDLYAGVHAALGCAGLQIRRRDVLDISTNEVAMAQPSLQAFLDRADRPSALVTQNDALALAALAAATALGIRVPADLSVVGFDDVPEAAASSPALTTVANPRTMLGREAVDLLLAAAAGAFDGAQTRVLQGYLIERSSTAAPRSRHDDDTHASRTKGGPSCSH